MTALTTPATGPARNRPGPFRGAGPGTPLAGNQRPQLDGAGSSGGDVGQTELDGDPDILASAGFGRLRARGTA